MDVREKLTALIFNADSDKNLGWYDLYDLVHEETGCAKYFANYLISHGVTVQKWISVYDRLPNLDEAVLVLAEYLQIKTNYYEVWSLFKCESGEIIWVDKSGNGHSLKEVTHWMPLPEPPKGE